MFPHSAALVIMSHVLMIREEMYKDGENCQWIPQQNGVQLKVIMSHALMNREERYKDGENCQGIPQQNGVARRMNKTLNMEHEITFRATKDDLGSDN